MSNIMSNEVKTLLAQFGFNATVERIALRVTDK